jgi:dihydroxyacetone kinase-like protein
LSGTAVDVALDVEFFHDWMGRLAQSIEANCDELTRLDAAIGDADHGINMLRGMKAAMEALSSTPPKDPADVFRVAGNRLVAVVGGAAGPLYGSAFRAVADALAASQKVSVPRLAQALRAGVNAIQRLGAAEPGDKTMVDAWIPAVTALEAAGTDSVRGAAAAAAKAAQEGMVATIPMRARKGRASYLGWRSEGHQDPGATSTHLLFAALVDATH